MNVEKVREALELALREHNDFMSQADLPIGSKKIEEALAELEKPAEDDAISLVDSWVLDHCGKYESAKTATDDLIPRIQQYAESYHAKKCAECVSVSAPRFESRSGTTTDVDK